MVCLIRKTAVAFGLGIVIIVRRKSMKTTGFRRPRALRCSVRGLLNPEVYIGQDHLTILDCT